MIANLLTILIGLWLAYRAIFSVPAGELSGLEMTAAGVAVIVLALWARRTNLMGWSSGTNVLLGAVILALVALQRAVTADPLFTFWMMLLIGITVAIVAMWAMLYRLDPAQPANSP
jgi:CHASE2 domain-containing sensor protein